MDCPLLVMLLAVAVGIVVGIFVVDLIKFVVAARSCRLCGICYWDWFGAAITVDFLDVSPCIVSPSKRRLFAFFAVIAPI
jgi:hypothetical protein